MISIKFPGLISRVAHSRAMPGGLNKHSRSPQTVLYIFISHPSCLLLELPHWHYQCIATNSEEATPMSAHKSTSSVRLKHPRSQSWRQTAKRKLMFVDGDFCPSGVSLSGSSCHAGTEYKPFDFTHGPMDQVTLREQANAVDGTCIVTFLIIMHISIIKLSRWILNYINMVYI